MRSPEEFRRNTPDTGEVHITYSDFSIPSQGPVTSETSGAVLKDIHIVPTIGDRVQVGTWWA